MLAVGMPQRVQKVYQSKPEHKTMEANNANNLVVFFKKYKKHIKISGLRRLDVKCAII
jgi:hypothetical protein